jgi:hypothetical protein
MRTVRSVLVAVLGIAAIGFASILFGKVPAPPNPTAGPQSMNLQNQGAEQAPPADSNPPAPQQGAHMDHKPKHGGAFFMSLDNKHHLEGVLLRPATFRVYLYDDHTKPLKAEETREASGTVQMGTSEDAPKISLAPGKKKETLEANLGDSVKFPVSITLLLHLPGMADDAKPELFNFTFTGFTDERGPGTCTPMPRMGMNC